MSFKKKSQSFWQLFGHSNGNFPEGQHPNRTFDSLSLFNFQLNLLSYGDVQSQLSLSYFLRLAFLYSILASA